ncbi:unnamed protein product, partial [marine sediment metagenome]
LFSLAIMALFTAFVKKTKLGIAMRATAESIETARLVGINVDRVIAIAFILGSAIASITGFMWGAKYGQISYDMGFMAGVKAFVAIVVGGVGRDYQFHQVLYEDVEAQGSYEERYFRSPSYLLIGCGIKHQTHKCSESHHQAYSRYEGKAKQGKT